MNVLLSDFRCPLRGFLPKKVSEEIINVLNVLERITVKNKTMKKEQNLQIQISIYLKIQYSDVLFTFEASGLRLPIGLAIKAARMRSGRGLPDLLILEPKGIWNGLCIELKTVSPYKKNGELKAGEHLKEQAEVLRILLSKGYYATFCTGFDETKSIIDHYMKL